MAYKILHKINGKFQPRQHNLSRQEAIDMAYFLRGNGGSFFWSRQRGLHIEGDPSTCPECLNEVAEMETKHAA